jgi:eukaryotic-like serine/threonine-protein kinase
MKPEEMAGQVLGHYRIIGSLGYGGTATVFLAEDIHLRREVALKVFQPESGQTQEFLRRFEREARVLAQLDHPNILPVYDYGEQRDIAYLVMPRMAGGSLKDRLRQQRIIAPVETVRLIGQVLDALQYAHDRGLIHRDIKPGNMLFKIENRDGRQERLLLSDFGLVKVLTTAQNIPLVGDLTHQSAPTVAGTPDYIAPEQIMGKATQASDIYSMGVVLYEMLTGERPFQAENYMGLLMKHLHEQPRPLRALNPRIEPALEAIALRAMEKEQEKRYQKPSDLQQALEWAINGGQAGIEKRDLYATTPNVQVQPADPPTPIPGSANVTPARQTLPGEQVGMTIPAYLTVPTPPVRPLQYNSAVTSPSHSSPTAADGQYNSAYSATNQPARTPGQPTRPKLLITLSLLAVVVIASLGGMFYIQNNGHTIIGGTTPQAQAPSKGGGTGAAITTKAVPKTSTECPAANTARAEVTAPLVLGNHQNIVYIVNEGTGEHPTAGTIKRRETSETVKGVEISRMPNAYISEAQVSQDGEWVLFTATIAGRTQMRMVRVDGQGLQTLYCAPANDIIANTQWSFNQQQVIFSVYSANSPIPANATIYLLDITKGKLQTELESQANLVYHPVTWLDKNHVYMTAVVSSTNTQLQYIYVLDTQKGGGQHDDDLQRITNPGCNSFDSSYDLTQLFISTCKVAPASAASTYAPVGPSTITVQSALGGQMKTLATVKQAVTMIRAVTPKALLLLVENYSGDKSQNGLWKINSDGTGLTRLTTDSANAQSLCLFTRYAWSNVSRDESMYALQEHDPKTNTWNMYYGSLSGGQPPYEFANISGTELLLAGWTRI